MDAFIFQADIYCTACAEVLKRNITERFPQDVPADPTDESSFDSDKYPKGPYADGGGEADSPQHCGKCGLFLENPLTNDGYNYVRDLLARTPDSPTVQEWANYYDVNR